MLHLTHKLQKLSIEDSTSAKLKKEFKLYDYQRRVVKWMRNKESANIDGISGGLICLTMGLGKTLIALYHTIRSREKIGEEFPTIVVMSKTLLYEWKNQGVEKFFNNVRVLYYHKDFIGTQAIKNMTTTELATYDIVITTYDVCLTIYRTHKYEDTICTKGDYGIHKGKIILTNLRKKPQFREVCGIHALYEMPWKRLFCDESQRFANPKTQTFRSVMALYADHRWCLSGTPIRNYETDIWAQLRFCGFDRIVHPRDWKRHHYKLYNCDSHIFVLNYSQANVEMPEKIDKVYDIEMDKKQQVIYKTILEKLENLFQKFFTERGITYIYILAMFVRLRQVCIAPNLLITKSTNKQVESFINDLKTTDNNELWLADKNGTAGIGSPKIAKATLIIKEIVEQKEPEKIIVFSMFVSSLKLMKLALDKEQIPCVMMIGETSVKERLQAMELFKETNTCNVMLIHYKVGGEGINLTEATHVIPLEPWWTHAVHNQGIHRAWRRGQTKPVTVHWLLIKDSIENRILELCKSKLMMANSYLHDFTEFNERTGIDIYGMRKLIFEQSEQEKITKQVRDWARDKDITALLSSLGYAPICKEEVSKMYKTCLLKIHPDKVAESERMRYTEIFKVVNEAYTRFKNG